MRALSRRKALLGLFSASGLATLPALDVLWSGAQAGASAKPKDRFYIFAYWGGGWDILLGLDPRDPEVFHDGNVRETRTRPGYHLLDVLDHGSDPIEAAPGMWVGPYFGDLAGHAQRLSIVRGLNMDTLTHEAGRRRFLTGRLPAGIQPRGSSISTWLSALTAEGLLAPQISLGVESFNLDLPNWATAMQVRSAGDLASAFRSPVGGLGEDGEALVDRFLRDEALCDQARRSPIWQAMEESRLGADAVADQELDDLFAFESDDGDMVALREHYGMIGNTAQIIGGAPARAAAAVQAITHRISRVVTLQVASGLDTHGSEWGGAQGPRQEAGFNLVARMMEDLAVRPFGDGSSWLDHTVIVGFSEFSRTAMLNASEGRDHALTNACLIAGGPVRGGRVHGASTEIGMGPGPINLQTGQPDPAGEVPRPDHVLRAVLAEAGFEDDVADLRAEPLRAIFRDL